MHEVQNCKALHKVGQGEEAEGMDQEVMLWEELER